MNINYQTGALILIGMCGILLVIGLMRNKVEWFLNLVMRSILGTIAMYFVNTLLGGCGIYLGVGINPVTVLTSGILGFPGVAMLYGITFYQIM